MNWRQIVLIVIVVVAGAAGIWWAFQPQPIGVDLDIVRRGTMTVTVDDEGLVQIKDTYQVSTPIGGDVQRIPLRVGDHVERDQVVATVAPQMSAFLDPRTLAESEAAVRAAEAAVLSARAELQAAQSELSFRRSEHQRTEQLLSRGLVTQQTADQSSLQLQRAESAVESAEAALELREQQLEQARARLLEPNGGGDRMVTLNIRAPIEGQVLAVANESARSLPAGSHLLTIGDPRDLEVVVDVLSTDAVKIVAGAPATIEDWGGEEILEAEVRRIEPIGFTKVSALGIEEQRVRIHLEIETEPAVWQSLGHLYRVFVRIETQRIEDTLMVPTAALFRQDGDWAVFTYEDGIARLHKVELGPRDAGLASVSNGLAEGDRVILHPNDQITDGGLVADRAVLQSE